MIIRNILSVEGTNLEFHEDDRGTIVDLFYDENINHVAMVKSEAGALRGNHYHKQSTQHMLMTKGSLEYWYKPLDSDESAKMVVATVGDVVSTPPNEVHALRIGPEGNEFIVFSEGVRGGMNYEDDTFRVDNIIEM